MTDVRARFEDRHCSVATNIARASGKAARNRGYDLHGGSLSLPTVSGCFEHVGLDVFSMLSHWVIIRMTDQLKRQHRPDSDAPVASTSAGASTLLRRPERNFGARGTSRKSPGNLTAQMLYRTKIEASCYHGRTQWPRRSQSTLGLFTMLLYTRFTC